MSDTRRSHLKPKAYRSRRPKRFKHSSATLKTPKQRRAAERRAWRRKELSG